MKSNLTKVWLALLSAVFVLGCQDQGTGLVEPGGLGPQFAKVKECPGHPSCKTPQEVLTLYVTIDSEQLTGSVSPVTVEVMTTGSLIFEDFPLDLSFFKDHTTCDNLGPQLGTLTMIRGDADGPHVHFGFGFIHNGSKHGLEMEGMPAPNQSIAYWSDPDNDRVAISYDSGYWSMLSQRCRQVVEEQYTWLRHNQQIDEILRETLTTGKAA